MNIKEFSYNLQKLYEEMSQAFSSFQKSMNLGCISSCGRCCLNPEIEASHMEMIPMALEILKEGKLDEWVEKLSLAQDQPCLIFKAGAREGEGQCGQYNTRPSVCRMFAVAGYFDRNHQINLSICKFIKETYFIQNPPTNLPPETTPVISQWMMKLSSLDPRLIHHKLPINMALLKALEVVSLYNSMTDTQISHSEK